MLLEAYRKGNAAKRPNCCVLSNASCADEPRRDANDNWQTTILGGIITSSQVSDIQNSGHAPTAASESATIANLQPGNYTAIVHGVNNTTGVALVEAYDLD